MRTTILVTIDPQAICLVNKGDLITPVDVIAQTKVKETAETINIAKLLKIAPANVPKYLNKTIGSEVEENDVIAVKKSLFQSYILKSPSAGILKEIDIKKGTLSLIRKVGSSKTEHKVTIPIGGKIISCGKTQIEIEIDALLYKGKIGQGSEAIGNLLHLKNEKISILDISSEAISSIVICQQVDDSAVAKFDVLETKGLVITKGPKDITLPWVLVDETVYNKLIAFSGKKVWLRPKEKEIIIIEN